MKNVKSNSNSSTEAAQGMQKETCITQFRKFDSPSFIVLKTGKQFELSRYRIAVGTWPSTRFIKFRDEFTESFVCHEFVQTECENVHRRDRVFAGCRRVRIEQCEFWKCTDVRIFSTNVV